MADPFQKLGISRTPAYELFGTPDVSRGGYSTATHAAVDADKAALDEAQALQDERDARARARQAEQAVDEYQKQQPSARQKFFDEQGAGMIGSKRYGEVENFQKAQPSYADRVLAKNIALKFEDPDARQIFNNEIARGTGSLAAQDLANTFIAKKQAAGELGKYYPPDEAEAMVANRHDPAYINYHIAKKKGETLFSKDPQAQALERYYHTLKDRAAIEAKDLSGLGEARPETMAEMKRVSELLGSKYRGLAEPATAAPGAAVPATPTTSAAAAAALRRKLGLVKP